MSPFIRKVPTGSGATAVQIAKRVDGRVKIIKHIGSAHTDTELALLLQAARPFLNPGQGTFDFDTHIISGSGGGQPAATGPVVTGQASRVLWDSLQDAYQTLGFDQLGDLAFEQLVLARLVEPASKAATIRILDNLGVPAPHISTVKRCLARIQERGYRDTISTACFT